MNQEVALLAGQLVNSRDARLSSYQIQIGAAASALGQLLTSLLQEQGADNWLQLIELASDAGRLLTDLHHEYSMSRRTLAMSNLDSKAKELLAKAPLDEWLFGEKISDRIVELLNGPQSN